MSRAENVVLTNLCMVEDLESGRVVVQLRDKKSWPGWAFPGGHVEKGESLHEAVVREILEETGLMIEHPQLVGVKHWTDKEVRYLVFHYKVTDFTGQLTSSSEGEVKWWPKTDLDQLDLAYDMLKSMELMDNPALAEFYYRQRTDEGWDKEMY